MGGDSRTSSTVIALRRAGSRIQRGPLAACHHELRELLPRGAVFVHVPLGTQCVEPDRKADTERALEVVGVLGCERHIFPLPRCRAVAHQHRLADPCPNEGARHVEMGDVGRSPDERGIHEAGLDSEVFGETDRSHAAAGLRDQAVDLVLGQARVTQGCPRCLRLEFQCGAMGCRSDIGGLPHADDADRMLRHCAMTATGWPYSTNSPSSTSSSTDWRPMTPAVTGVERPGATICPMIIPSPACSPAMSPERTVRNRPTDGEATLSVSHGRRDALGLNHARVDFQSAILEMDAPELPAVDQRQDRIHVPIGQIRSVPAHFEIETRLRNRGSSRSAPPVRSTSPAVRPRSVLRSPPKSRRRFRPRRRQWS